jgi:hypothetical protein
MSCQFTYLTLYAKVKYVNWHDMDIYTRFVDIGGIVDHHCLNFLFILVELLTITV